MIKKFVCSICIFLIITFYFNFVEATEQIYYPHPVIFVHGINSSSSTWITTKPEIEKYFYDETTSECKYFPIANPYLSAIDYPNKGDIPTSALIELKNAIDDAIKGLPDDQKKVVIVAHSMGGLVTRTLLGLLTDYQNKIDKVVFIGTPHLGSPYASAVWLLNKIRNEIIYPALADYPSFYSMSVGSRFRFSDSSSFLTAIGLPSQIYSDLSSKLQKEAQRFDTALVWPDGEGLTESIALEQLRLNQDVTFRKTIESSLKGKKSSINLYGQIFGDQTFLGQANYLAIPSSFKLIMGREPYTVAIFAYMIQDSNLNSLFMGIPNLLTLGIDNFSYPPNLSITDAIDMGDGIVPQASQEGIRTPADYTVNSFHVGETNQYQTILQAIEDAPVIESVRLVRKYKYANMYYRSPFYIVIKVKDYLLADIEIAEMNINNKTLQDFPEFYDASTNTYKPYVKFKKDFLKERFDEKAPIYGEDGNFDNDTGIFKEYLHLYPGEFYVEVWNGGYGLAPYGYIRLKNPAQKEAECQIVNVVPIDSFYGSANVERFGSALGTTSYGQIRDEAYNDFSLDTGQFYKTADHSSFYVFNYARGSYSFRYENGNRIDTWSASMRMDSPSFINFNLTIGDKKVKSAKLAGTFLKAMKNGGTDFSLLVYRDTSDTWPPTLNSAGNIFLFNIDTSSHIQWDDFEYNVDSMVLNGNGPNVWSVKQDFTIENFIPPSPEIEYIRHAGIWDPRLILIFDNQEAQ